MDDLNRVGERVRSYPGFKIPVLENCPPFYPTNSYLSYVYMVPSTKDVIYVSSLVQRTLAVKKRVGLGYENSCLGELHDRMSDEEKAELEPYLENLLSDLVVGK